MGSSMTPARRAELRRLALRECAKIIETALGTDLDVFATVNDPAERQLIEIEMRRISDRLHGRATPPAAIDSRPITRVPNNPGRRKTDR